MHALFRPLSSKAEQVDVFIIAKSAGCIHRCTSRIYLDTSINHAAMLSFSKRARRIKRFLASFENQFSKRKGTDVNSSPDNVLEQITRSQKSWLILDYEGALTDRESIPDDHMPDSSLANMLVDLARRPAISVAVLSSWQLEDLRALLPVPGLWLAGSFGAEWSIPDEEGVLRLETSSDPASSAENPGQEQAISFLMEREPADYALWVFVGNGESDAGAAGIVHDHGGVAMEVSASSEPAAADFRFASSGDVRRWLKKIILKVPPISL
jgi:hypothetical protein